MKEVTTMGLDLIILVQSDFGTDEQGRNTYKVTQLCNLRNCWVILDQLNNRLESGFSNCATYTFYGETFHGILKDMQEELTELTELSKVKELTDYQKSRMGILSDEISELEGFIETNNVPNDDTQDYQVHAWW